MAILSVLTLPANGVSTDDILAGNFVAADVGGTDYYRNTGNEVLLVRNSGAGGIVVTISSVPDSFNRTQDEVINVAAGEISIVGTLPTSAWNQPSPNQGKVELTSGTPADTEFLVFRAR